MLHAALTLGLILVAGAPDARAQVRAEGAWCALVQGPDGGYVSCAYSSWRQCQAALSGLGGICHLNPAGAERPQRKRRG
jgi:hypothetical protein